MYVYGHRLGVKATASTESSGNLRTPVVGNVSLCPKPLLGTMAPTRETDLTGRRKSTHQRGLSGCPGLQTQGQGTEAPWSCRRKNKGAPPTLECSLLPPYRLVLRVGAGSHSLRGVELSLTRLFLLKSPLSGSGVPRASTKSRSLCKTFI